MKIFKFIISLVAISLFVSINSVFAQELNFTEDSLWNDYKKQNFSYKGRAGYIVIPKEPRADRAWIFTPAFFGAFPIAEKALLEKGFHILSAPFASDYGNPQAVELAKLIQDAIAEKYGLHPKVTLEGISRGGAFSINYASTYPESVACIYLDAGVCDFGSWPSRKDEKMWKALCKKWNVDEIEDIQSFSGNPINRSLPIAKAQIAIISVAGDSDKVVPHNENIEVFLERYKANGGENFKLILDAGKGHHPHGLKDPTPVVEFIENIYDKLAK